MAEKKETFQVPFRYGKQEAEIIKWLQDYYHEVTISKTIKRCLRDIKMYIEFREKIKEAITKETKFKIDQEFVKKEFYKFDYDL